MKWKVRVLPVLVMIGIIACSAARAEDVLVGNLDQGVPSSAGGPLYDVIQSPVAGDPRIRIHGGPGVHARPRGRDAHPNIR